MKVAHSLLTVFAICLPMGANFAAQTPDAEYEAVAEEYIRGYLAAHPLQGTALGFHEYDGKIGDYSRLALDAELSRLRRFDDRLKKIDGGKLSQRQSIDLRILQAAIKKELFQMQEMSVFERNPMTYARAADVNVIVEKPDRGLTCGCIVEHIVGVAVAVKVADTPPSPATGNARNARPMSSSNKRSPR